MICVPCNLQFHNASLKRCTYCDHKLTEKGRPEVKNGMSFPDEMDKGQKGEIHRPVVTAPRGLRVGKMCFCRPTTPQEHRIMPTNRKLRIRSKPNRVIKTAEGVKGGKRRATTK